MTILLITVVFALGSIFGLLLGHSFKKYVGVINISESGDGKKLYLLEVNGDPENLDQHKSVSFKVVSSQPY